MSDETIFLKNGQKAVLANYKNQDIQEYRGNPFIEALPKILTTEEVIDNLSVFPIFDQSEKLYSAEVRVHIIQRLFRYFQPLENHLELEREISTTIREGYISRNPISREYAQSFIDGYENIINKNLDIDINRNSTASLGFFLKGISGIGKTTAINRILSLYPQIIVHSNYKGINFSMYQLTWLKLDCPHDGSIKGLCLDFFIKIDNTLGSNFYKKYSVKSLAVNALMPILAQVANSCGLGLLIIDEIQHLSLAKSGGIESMLNFFVTLVNTIGIPVILIGTHKAAPMLQSQFRQARRSCGQASNEWNQMKKDENWDIFLDTMFQFQWTDEDAELTNELSSLLYYESQGITDIVLKVFAVSQIECLIQGKKCIDISIIKRVCKNNLKLVQPMLDALRSGDIKKIHKYEDLRPIDISEYCEQSYQTAKEKEDLKVIKNIAKSKRKVKENAMALLLALGVDNTIAKNKIEEITSKNPNITKEDLVQEVYRYTLESTDNNKNKFNKNKSNKDVSSIENKDDLRYITNQDGSNYDNLVNHGSIKEFD